MSENEKDINVEVNTGTEDINEDQLETTMERFFYHQRRAMEETGKALEALLPPDFRTHANEASREFAKGFRILIDDAIDELKKVSERDDEDANEPVAEADAEAVQDTAVDNSDDDDDDTPPSTGKTKVKVKVD